MLWLSVPSQYFAKFSLHERYNALSHATLVTDWTLDNVNDTTIYSSGRSCVYQYIHWSEEVHNVPARVLQYNVQVLGS